MDGASGAQHDGRTVEVSAKPCLSAQPDVRAFRLHRAELKNRAPRRRSMCI